MAPTEQYLGLDFGTESVRALLVDDRGRITGSAVAPYRHGQITTGSAEAAQLFAAPLPPEFALQHPGDWLAAAGPAVRGAVAAAETSAAGAHVAGLGVDFTSCTVVPARRDGTALVESGLVDPARPHVWPKLWKHHGAVAQAATLTAVAAERQEPWLARYGGTVGLEWFFPKILEVIDQDPEAAATTEVWVEAGDWLVWQLTGAPSLGGAVDAEGLVRSTCQAGYKALWSRADGYPSSAYFEACDPALGAVLDKQLPGRFHAPGDVAGALSSAAAELLGLASGIPVSTAVIDAHAGVPGAGVGEPGALVVVLGTSGCHLVMDDEEHTIEGVAGVVADGILPGYFGYETGQAAMGDLFDWVRRLCGRVDHTDLEREAAAIAPGADGVLVLDWFNGCRTPLMDGRLRGAIVGLDLHHGPAHLYRAALEASACGLRWVVETLRDGGVAIDRVVATGGLAQGNRLFAGVVASVLGEPVFVSRVPHGPARGSAILGAVAAGRFDTAAEAVDAMAGPASAVAPPLPIHPDAPASRIYDDLYRRYRSLAELLATDDARFQEDR
jgi:L-ribulokinase